MKALARPVFAAVERGWVPDTLVRRGIRSLCQQRLKEIATPDGQLSARVDDFARQMSTAPVAPLSYKANEQHYEVPAAFFEKVLGSHLKYSCAYWDDGASLDDAEAHALASTCQHADLHDGQHVLELGCGWGSLTLWMARHYPNSRITAVSNSSSQRAFIEAQACCEGLKNVQIITADMNHFSIDQRFDRLVSVEMFEHLRNYGSIFGRLSEWLVPGGRFFMHIFCHRTTPYTFEQHDDSDWMSRHFFTGGMMPSVDLPLRFQKSLEIAQCWNWSGIHYQKTAEAWLMKLDKERDAIKSLFADVYGVHQADLWLNRWRVFFMACAELFGLHGGREWLVCHYLFDRR